MPLRPRSGMRLARSGLRRLAPRPCPAGRTEPATMQHVTCNIQAYTVQHTSCTTHRATHIVQHAHATCTCNMCGRGRSAASALQSAFCTVCDAWWLRPLHTARLSCTLHLARCNLHVASCTLHPARCILHVVRCTSCGWLRPYTPYTLHTLPTPHTLRRRRT